jgi:hypothetical protein
LACPEWPNHSHGPRGLVWPPPMAKPSKNNLKGLHMRLVEPLTWAMEMVRLPPRTKTHNFYFILFYFCHRVAELPPSATPATPLAKMDPSSFY